MLVFVLVLAALKVKIILCATFHDFLFFFKFPYQKILAVMLTKLPAGVNDDMFSFTSIINAITFYVSDNTIHGKKKKKSTKLYVSSQTWFWPKMQ